ncbi:hypothetical protein P389DRAFT_191131 [Cystobasidium minutum MCA 4210]|uniref:uncharacterized protein n=1 Tax=Cystobasidium minutum MCA 4210 TaxID=1397322 RepID=UPI0034CD68B1|eukprot:jgi/Rhomi1/191131/estExt_fgenesh1_pg.C_70115
MQSLMCAQRRVADVQPFVGSMNYHIDRPRLPPLREALGYDPQGGAPPTTLPPLPPPSARNLRYAQSYAQLPRAGSSSQSSANLSNLSASSASPSRRLGSSVSTLDLRRPPGRPRAPDMSNVTPVPLLHRRASSQRFNTGPGGLPPTPTSASGPSFGSLSRSTSFETVSSTAGFCQPDHAEHASAPGTILTPSSYPAASSYSGYFPPPQGVLNTPDQTSASPYSPGVSGQFSGLHLLSPGQPGHDGSSASLSAFPHAHSQNVSGLRQSPSNPYRQNTSSSPSLHSNASRPSGFSPYPSPALPSLPLGDQTPPFEPSNSRSGSHPHLQRNAFRRHSSETSLNPHDTGSDSGPVYHRLSSTTSPQLMDSFAPQLPHAAHNYPSTTTFPSPANYQHQGGLHRQRSMVSHPRGRRYLPPPGPLENLISNSGLLDSSGNLTSLPPLPPLGPPGRNTCENCTTADRRPPTYLRHMWEIFQRGIKLAPVRSQQQREISDSTNAQYPVTSESTSLDGWVSDPSDRATNERMIIEQDYDWTLTLQNVQKDQQHRYAT